MNILSKNILYLLFFIGVLFLESGCTRKAYTYSSEIYPQTVKQSVFCNRVHFFNESDSSVLIFLPKKEISVDQSENVPLRLIDFYTSKILDTEVCYLGNEFDYKYVIYKNSRIGNTPFSVEFGVENKQFYNNNRSTNYNYLLYYYSDSTIYNVNQAITCAPFRLLTTDSTNYYPVAFLSKNDVVHDRFLYHNIDTLVDILDSNVFFIKKVGTYLFQSPQLNKKVYIVCNSTNNEFELTTRDMLQAIAYISNNIYDSIADVPDSLMKVELDKFWLDLAGNNIEKARTLIKEYYNRIWLSNLYFTSYKQGWLTDRGLVYTLFGTPLMIDVFNNKEDWFYDNIFGSGYLKFRFSNKKLSESIYDYILDKKSEYNLLFLLAIEQWQEGRNFHLGTISKN